MDDGLKQRIVGAIVLVTLAMIFLPMVFDDVVNDNRMEVAQIPPPPQMDSQVIQDPEKFASKIDAPVNAQAHQDKRWAEQEQAAVTPITDGNAVPLEPVSEGASATPTSANNLQIKENGLPEAWTLQVGTFGDKKNAETLREKLFKKGYTSYIREMKGDKGSTFKVYVGPDVDRINIEKTMKKILELKQELKISGVFIKPYEP